MICCRCRRAGLHVGAQLRDRLVDDVVRRRGRRRQDLGLGLLLVRRDLRAVGRRQRRRDPVGERQISAVVMSPIGGDGREALRGRLHRGDLRARRRDRPAERRRRRLVDADDDEAHERARLARREHEAVEVADEVRLVAGGGQRLVPRVAQEVRGAQRPPANGDGLPMTTADGPVAVGPAAVADVAVSAHESAFVIAVSPLELSTTRPRLAPAPVPSWPPKVTSATERLRRRVRERVDVADPVGRALDADLAADAQPAEVDGVRGVEAVEAVVAQAEAAHELAVQARVRRRAARHAHPDTAEAAQRVVDGVADAAGVQTGRSGVVDAPRPAVGRRHVVDRRRRSGRDQRRDAAEHGHGHRRAQRQHGPSLPFAKTSRPR